MATWSSSSGSQSTATAAGAKDGCGDRMLRIELDAAEALAALAHSAVPENEIPGSNEGGRPNRRVKNESPPGDSGMNPALPVLRSSDPGKQCEKTHNAMMKSVKVEQDAELPKSSPMSSTSYEFFSGNNIKTLTEGEKEARRTRRVLANRESARKTIRRRQATYEEMNRKAVSLALENENLKREKELAFEEYDNLKRTNECLKAQMAETIKTEVEEIREDSKSGTTSAEIPTSSTNHPLLLYNQPQFSPFLWSPIIQSSNPMQLQHGPQNAFFLPSKVDSFHEQKNPPEITGPGTPLYIVPCPWFFPLPDHGNGIHMRPFSDPTNERNGTAICSQSGISSSPKTIPSEGFLLVSSPISSIRCVSTVEPETRHQPNHSPNDQAFSSTSSHAVNALPKTEQDVIVCPTGINTEADAAAEARKRRKELTKLKTLHCRQFQMHC